MADFEKIVEIITEKFGAEAVEVKERERFPWLLLKADQLVEIGLFLRDDPQLQFSFLRSLSAVDFEEKFAVVYHLASHELRHELALRVETEEREKPSIPSLSEVWPAAEWHEREAYDLMGIDFPGNRDMRRLLLPDDWEGHPLRKDWVDPPTVYNIPTQRLTGLELAQAEREKSQEGGK